MKIPIDVSQNHNIILASFPPIKKTAIALLSNSTESLKGNETTPNSISHCVGDQKISFPWSRDGVLP